MKILIIEDSIEIMESLIEYLEIENHTILSSYTGESGLDLIKIEKPLIIISDLELPDINGLEIIKKIKNNKDIYGDPKIIILSGNDDKRLIFNALEIGADIYIKKPFEYNELSEAINKLTDENYSLEN